MLSAATVLTSLALPEAEALPLLDVIFPSRAAATATSLPTTTNDSHHHHLRSRPAGASFTLTDQEASTEDDYDIRDVLLSFIIRNPRSDVLRQPAGRNRKLAEAAHAEATTHAENEDEADGHEGDHGDAHDMVVHVTYEHIYAILVFLITATALGIVTSKLGMVSYVLLTSMMHLLCYFYTSRYILIDIACMLFYHQFLYSPPLSEKSSPDSC